MRYLTLRPVFHLGPCYLLQTGGRDAYFLYIPHFGLRKVWGSVSLDNGNLTVLPTRRLPPPETGRLRVIEGGGGRLRRRRV